MEVIEWVGVAFGIAAVYLLVINHVFTWPLGLVNILCFLWLFWHQNLYGDFVVQIIFLLTGAWGWLNWSKQEVKIPEMLNFKNRILFISITLLIFPLIYFYLNVYTQCSYPILEALILDLSLVGQILTAMRKFENWFWWVIADVLMVMVYLQKGLYPTAVYAAIIFCLGIKGARDWHKMIKSGLAV